MKPQTLRYLQKDEIGQVIATGLATLYINKPDKPVRYLAEWLRNYSNNNKQMQRLKQVQKAKAQAAKLIEQAKKTQQADKAHRVKEQQAIQSQIEAFKATLTNHDYHQQLLEQVIPEFLQQHTHATGVYIGELTHPPKPILQDDIDPLAHLDTSAAKVIHYIGSSLSHKDIIRGKILPAGQGIGFSSFSLLDQVPASVVGDDGVQIPRPLQSKYIFVPDVVKKEGIFYFRIPKLGSYLVVPVHCDTVLSQENFDIGLKARLQYYKEVEELEQAKREELEELNKQKQQLEKKISELKQKNADVSQLEPLETELTELNEAIVQKREQKVEQKLPQLQQIRRSFIFAADTLGKDIKFSEDEIKFICEIVQHFKTSWQTKQRQILTNDIELEIEALENLQPYEACKKNQEHILELTQEEEKEIGQMTTETAKNKAQAQLQLTKLKREIEGNQPIFDSFLFLKKLRVIKFPELIQTLLYFIGLRKEEINLSGRTVLDWKSVKSVYISQSTISALLSYNPVGPRQQPCPAYRRTPHLLQQLQRFDEQAVFEYNFALGIFLVYMKAALHARKADIEHRRVLKEEKRAERDRILQQNEKIQTKLQQQLNKYKSASEGAQKYNQQQWLHNYKQQNPLLQVPEQQPQDIDADI